MLACKRLTVSHPAAVARNEPSHVYNVVGGMTVERYDGFILRQVRFLDDRAVTHTRTHRGMDTGKLFLSFPFPQASLTPLKTRKLQKLPSDSSSYTLIIFYKGQCYFWPRLCPLFLAKYRIRMSLICPLFLDKFCS